MRWLHRCPRSRARAKPPRSPRPRPAPVSRGGSSAGPVGAAIAVAAAVGVAQAIDAQVAARVADREIAGDRGAVLAVAVGRARVGAAVPGRADRRVDRTIGVGQTVDARAARSIAARPARAVGVSHAGDAGAGRGVADAAAAAATTRAAGRDALVPREIAGGRRRGAIVVGCAFHAGPRRRIAHAAARAGGVDRASDAAAAGDIAARRGSGARIVGVAGRRGPRVGGRVNGAAAPAPALPPPPPALLPPFPSTVPASPPVSPRTGILVGDASLPQPAINPAAHPRINQAVRSARSRNILSHPQKAQKQTRS